MTVVVDAGPLVAVADEREPRREAILAILRGERGGLFIPAPVTAEIGYLLGQRFGPRARRAFLDDLAARRYETPGLDADDYREALWLDHHYADLDLGLADLSVAVLARKLATRRILTFDNRHFRVIKPLQGGAFMVLPADAESGPESLRPSP
jgi:uncharacterized protein